MIIVFFLASVLLSCLPFLHSTTDLNTTMSTCPNGFTCPKISPFEYPFYNTSDSRCGLIKVNCSSSSSKIKFGEESFEIVSKFMPGPSVLIRNRTFETQVNDQSCDALMDNFTSPIPLLYSITIVPFITLYKCKTNGNDDAKMEAYFKQSDYNRYTRCRDHNFYYQYIVGESTIPSDLPSTCEVIRLPVIAQWSNGATQRLDETNIFSLLNSNFSVTFHVSSSCKDCRKREGECHAQDGSFQCLNARKYEKQKHGKTLLLTIVFVVSASIVIIFFVIFIIRRCYKTKPLLYVSSKDKSFNVEGGKLFFGVPVFSYTELEDATRNFDPSQELGNGGFGAVYYGKLQDGREVAVKRLYEHNYKRVQQFMNEVQILTKLRHPNLVVLYGCTSRQSHELLLVYEYISNGTISDHLHGDLSNSRLLTWPLRMNVAIETAKALVYLHASEIIHRDVKTSNILLDQNFSAKVADFGLSRLIPNDVTHISTAPQGTPGYVDPQYHHCYQLTDKSDVYSFGVVLIELISSMVAVDLNRSQDEISLADLALNKIQRSALDELIDPGLRSDEDPEVMQMITSVAELAFQCLQYYSDMRPTMSEVLDMLEKIQANGRTDSIDDRSNQQSRIETSDKTVLLKNFLPSPVSVNGEWLSDSTGSKWKPHETFQVMMSWDKIEWRRRIWEYPFYNTSIDNHCGLINVNCTSNGGGNIIIGGESHEIVSKYVSDPLVMIRNHTFERLVNETNCDALMDNFTSPSPLLYSFSILPFITLYKCHKNQNYTGEKLDAYFGRYSYSKYNRCDGYDFYYDYTTISYTVFLNGLPSVCQIIQLPVKFRGPGDNEVPDRTNIFSIFGSTFSVSFNLTTSCNKCHQDGGRCNISDGGFQCLVKERPQRKLKQIVALSGSAFVLIFLLAIFIIWRRYKTNPFSYFSSKDRSRTADDRSLFHGVSVFSYAELEDATRHFNPTRELGNGGFGAVYYGKLSDGREVAVKRLYEHNYKRVQQFVNEVRILTKLRHPNLVVLYGCTSQQSHELILVYEYISNGTLADHLHGDLANRNLLPWPLRMDIAIETARALVYLHASEIIHRDVKTSNILLDHNFSAKVADFGLSRLFTNDVAHLSTAPQGTPGYVDPQYHHRYQLTDKSDVYSFGVVLIELISSMVAVDLNRSQDEISLANLALNKIQRCAIDQLIDPVLGFDKDPEVMKQVTAVAELAFRCLQFYAEMRPTMNEVLDSLKDIQGDSIGELKIVKPLPLSETTDKMVSLKDFPPSPVSFSSEWHSGSTVSTTLSVR
ncbi:hypothetical protein LXL04_024998 [Taraxacum kok-saghyz]